MSLLALAAGLAILSPRASAQQLQSTPVYPDDSPQAQGALDRARELSGAGNIAEAARVIQQLLDTDAERVIPDPSDASLFTSLRVRVHELLLSAPLLLERYRVVEEPRARDQLAEGKYAQAERSRLLTRSGLEATLLVAQDQLESARFEAARIALEQLESHPDRKDKELAAKCAALARRVAGYLDRPETRAWAERWTKEAGASEPVGDAVRPPARAALRAQMPIPTRAEPSNFSLDADAFTRIPLQSVWISDQVKRDLGDLPELHNAEHPGAMRAPGSDEPWIFPTAFGDLVYISDGYTTTAMDRFTLAPVWSVSPKAPGEESVSGAFDPSGEETLFRSGMGRMLEDSVSVAVGSGVAVVCTGLAYQSGHDDVERIYALDAASGRQLWSANVARLADGLENAGVRGTPVIDGDTLILGVKKTGQARRLLGLYMIGIDIRDGSTKWSRMLGSAGVLPRGGSGRISDSPVLGQGLVYRSDEMGLVAAVESATGRPRWVRTLDPGEPRIRENAGAWCTSTPILDAGRLLVLSPDRDKLIILDALTGKTIATRDARSLGDPNYLVRVGNQLACVGDTAAFVALDKLKDGPVTETPSFAESRLTGRAVDAAGKLLIPTGQGLVIADPADPKHPRTLELAHSGNVVPSGEHLLVADATRLYSYLVWDRAEKLVRARIEASPKDPRPAFTYAELAVRSGKTDRIVPAMDGLIKTIAADASTPAAITARRALFDLAADLLTRGLRPAQETKPAPIIAAAQSEQGPPIRDLAVLDAVLQRLSRCAESDKEQIQALLLTGGLRQAQGAPDKAIASYQEIIQSPALSVAPYVAGNAEVRAEVEAARLVRDLVRSGSARVYAAFDAEAARARAELGDAAAPAALVDLVRRYPAAAQNAELLSLAADRAGATGDAAAAAGLLERALASAEESVAAGRDELMPAIGQIGGKLVAQLARQDRPASALRILRRLSKEYPRAGLTAEPSLDAALRSLEQRVASAVRPARIGSTIGPDVQTLEGWELLTPISRERSIAPSEHVLMYSPGKRQLALWGIGADASGLKRAWSREIGPTRPTLVRLDSSSAMLFWATPDGGELERVELAEGKPIWRTPSFDVMSPPNADPNQGDPRLAAPIRTPMDGTAKLTDLVIGMDEQMAVLAQRGGRVVAIDLATGKPMWTNPNSIDRVYDVSVGAGRVMLAGLSERLRDDALGIQQIPLLRELDARTGQVLQTIASDARWVRVISDDLAIAGLSEKVVGLDLKTRRQRWEVGGDPAHRALDAWVFGQRLILLDQQRDLWVGSALTGTMGPAPISTGARIGDRGPVRAQAVGESIVFAFDHGMLVIGPNSELAGMDPLGALSELITPVLSERYAVAVDSELIRQGDQQTFRVMLMDVLSGKLIKQQPIAAYAAPQSLVVLDGRIVVTCGSVTLVIPAR